MIIGPGVSINGGANFVVAQDQYYPSNALLLSYGSNVSPIGTAQSFTQDASPNNFAVNINGDTQATSFTPFQPDGYWSNYFDGTGDYLTVASNTSFGFGTGDFTIEFWHYTIAKTQLYPSLVNNQATSAWGANKWAFYDRHNDASTKFTFWVYNYNTTTPVITSTLAPQNNTWYHIALVRSGSTFSLYINGALDTTYTNSNSLDGGSSQPIGIGYSDAASTAYHGYISNLRVVKGTALYTTTFTPSTTPLTAIANTSLLTCQSNRFIDNSTNNFTITPSGNASVTVTEPFGWRASGSSANITNASAITSGYSSTAFNGSTDYLVNGYQINPQYNLSTGSWTVEAWVYKTSNAAGTILNLSNNGTTAPGLHFWINSSNQLVQDNGASATTAAGSITINTWTHVAAVCNGTNTQLYVSGTAVGSVITQLPSAAQYILIGAYAGPGTPFPGYISNLRIVRGVTVYTGSFTPSTIPLGLTQSAGTNISAITQGQTIFLLNGNTGGNNISFVDNSTNQFAITRNGDVAQGTLSPYSAGYYSNYFDGTGDNLSISSDTAFSFSTGDFTIELWANFNNTTVDRAFVSRYNASTGWNFRYDGSGISFFNGDTGLISKAFTPVVGLWYHLAVSRQGTSLRLFINGVLENTVTNSTSLDNSNTLYIGRLAAATAWEFSGYISNVRIVKGTAVYTATFTVSTTPLTAIANTSLLTCQSNRIVDNSVYGFSLTRNGDVSVRGWTPFVLSYSASTQGGSAYFDGSGDWLEIPYNATLDLSTGNWTIECWWYPTVLADQTIVMINYIGGDGYAQARIAATAAGAFAILSASGPTTWINTSSIGSYTTGQWRHLAYVRNGSTFSLYVNGVLAGSYTSASNLQSASGVSAVGRTSSSISSFNYTRGYVSDVRVVKGTALYTANFTPPTSPLTAVTNTSLLLNLSNFNTYDLTLSTTLTSVGSTSQNTRIPFALPTVGIPYSSISTYGSGYFDGTGDYLTVGTTSSFNFLHNSTALFTIEGWVYCPSFASSVAVFGTNSGASGEIGAVVWINSSAQLRLLIGRGVAGNPVIDATSTGTVPLNQWVHVAVTYNQSLGSANCNFYINGTSAGSANKTANAPSSSNSTYPGTINAFGTTSSSACYLSNIRVNNSIVYIAAFTIPSIPLTAITGTRLLTLQQDGPANNNSFIDNSPNSFVITRNGNTTQGSFTPYWPNGYWSNYFNGTTAMLTLPSTALFSIATSTTPFTIETWLYPIAAGGAIFSEAYTGSGDAVDITITMSDGVQIYNNDGKTIAFGYYSGSVWVAAAMANSEVPLNAWTHISCVFTGATTKIYYNGVDVTKTSSPTPATTWGRTGSSGNSWIIGRRWDTAGSVNYFSGYMSNFRFVNGSAVYTVGFTPSTTPLTAIANTVLLSCQSSSFVNNAASNIPLITANGSVSNQRFIPFSPPAIYSPTIYGGSAYFDGTGDYLNTTSTTVSNLSGNLTYEAWIYPTSISSIRYLYCQSGGNGAFMIYLDSGVLKAGIYAGSTISFVSAVQANAWAHVAVTRSGNTWYGFVNGILGATSTTALTVATDRQTRIGISPIADLPYVGYMSDVRVISGQALYTQNFTVPNTVLTATTNTNLLLNMNNAAIYDRTNSVDLETVANTQTLTSVRNLGAGCMYFDGTGDFLTIVANPGFNFGTGDFTIECWINKPAAANGPIIDARGNATAIPYAFYVDGSNFPYFYQGTIYTSSVAITNNQWNHIAVTRSNGTLRIFVNGVQGLSSTVTTALNPSTFVLIGGQNFGASAAYTNGYIDNLRVVKGVALYTSNFSVPTTNPLYQ